MAKSKIRSPVSRLEGLWQPGILLTALVFSIPVLTIASFLLYPSGDIWQHLVDTVLADYLLNSVLLMTGVGLGTFSMGVTCAWLTSLC
ncbi:MAG: iron ABC transporter permease, partial [Gammaproteobacteria bacterium]|nr:iron ABC transporter permease [Gammaproteobacteria bacterium]